MAKSDEVIEEIRDKVIYLCDNVVTRREYDAHVERDEEIVEKYIRPLWEKSQQDIGAQAATQRITKHRQLSGVVAGWAINAGISIIAAWAAVKGIAK